MIGLFVTMKSSKKSYEVNQICNDWITCKNGFNGSPISPRTVVFKGDNIDKVIQLHNDGQLGQMFNGMFDLEHFENTGEFRRKK